MNPKRIALIVALVGAGILGSLPSLAQEGPAPGGPRIGDGRGRRGIAERMRGLFAARLKSDVGLDDGQVEAVLPRIETLEQERARFERERGATLRELRRGLVGGSSDRELQSLLDRLDRLADDRDRATREGLREIDGSLTVPQRVRLRFLLVRFRAEMAERIREFRQGEGPFKGARGRSWRTPAPPAPTVP